MSANVITKGEEIWAQLFYDLKTHGTEIHARGTVSREIEDYCIRFDPLRDVYCLFDSRKLSFKYLAGEFAWYLRGDRDDDGIEEYSKFWSTIANESSPRFNSNYGHYYFTEQQFLYCFESLLRDKETRQACIMINRSDVMMSNAKDKLCTNAVMFRIRDNKLNMTVQMRSNDVVFGLGIDAVLFSWMMQMMHVMLLSHYPDLELGTYFHTAASMHIYDRHDHMLDDISEGIGAYSLSIPRISSEDEVLFLLTKFGDLEKNMRKGWDFEIPAGFSFTSMLVEALLGKEPEAVQ